MTVLALAATVLAEARGAPVPRPHLRPLDAPAAQAPPGPSPDPAPWPAAEVAAAREACRTLLSGMDYEQLPPLGAEGSCGAPAPVLLSRVGTVTLSPPATLTCPMAAALRDWLSDSVEPAARRRLGTSVTEIHTATSYACRRRNNSATGKMSEHARANALDMAGFSFAGKTEVPVGGSWGRGVLGTLGLSKDGTFLSDIRAGACQHFTTVLGPGSDPYHGDHFHVDVLARKGGDRICQ